MEKLSFFIPPPRGGGRGRARAANLYSTKSLAALTLFLSKYVCNRKKVVMETGSASREKSCARLGASGTRRALLCSALLCSAQPPTPPQGRAQGKLRHGGNLGIGLGINPSPASPISLFPAVGAAPAPPSVLHGGPMGAQGWWHRCPQHPWPSPRVCHR